MMVVVVIGPGELKKTAGQSTSADALLLAFLASGFHQEFSEPGFDALGHNNGDVGDTALVVFAEHLALLVSECDKIHAIERDAQIHPDNAVDEHVMNALEQIVDALSGEH
jgi:hypothetical protein